MYRQEAVRVNAKDVLSFRIELGRLDQRQMCAPFEPSQNHVFGQPLGLAPARFLRIVQIEGQVQHRDGHNPRPRLGEA